MSLFEGSTLFLVRHPEAVKNIEDRHGGKGSVLTTHGRLQCVNLGRFFQERFRNKPEPLLIGHEVQHVLETLDKLGTALATDYVTDERLRGIDIGVLAGLSKEEASRRWPESAAHLEEWRIGARGIDRLSISGAEDVDNFRTRVDAALAAMVQAARSRAVISILTRSTLIMIINLVRLRENFNFSAYRRYEFDPASLTIIELAPSGPVMTLNNSLEHLDNGN